MRKLLVMLLAAILVLSMGMAAIGAEEAPQGDPKDVLEYLWDLSGELSDEEFSKLSVRNFKFVQSIEPLVEETSYHNLYKASVHVKQKTEGYREEFIAAEENLILKTSVADGVYFLWDADNMPVVDGEEFTEEELDKGPLDSYGFIPLIVKCLIDDPAQARGNLIVVSGGGFTNRSNSSEAYPAVEVFNDLGYNVFVLQRRLRPYSNEDIWMDMQRAIRVVRYYAEQEGLGGQDMIAACGWSGGSGTLMGAVNYLYGDLNPTVYSSVYVPDEIDEVSSDLDVALPIYGGWIDADCGNTNLPALYTSVGMADETSDPFTDIPMPQNVQKLYDDWVALGLPARIDIFEGAGHGYGVGQEGAQKGTPECALWPGYADAFMQENLGFSHRNETVNEEWISSVTGTDQEVEAEAEGDGVHLADGSIHFPESADNFVKAKAFYGYYILMDTDVIFALNEEETRFAVKFNGIGGRMPMYMEGDVHEDGTVRADDTYNGLFGEDIQTMYEDALEEEEDWAPITR